MWVHLDTVILAATLIRWLECAVVSGAVESDELVESVAKALKGAATSVNYSIGPTCLATITIGFADHLLRNFNDSVKDVAKRAAKLASRSVSRAGRRLDVSHGTGGRDD